MSSAERRFKICFNGKDYLNNEFLTKEQIVEFVKRLMLPDGQDYRIGEILNPRKELTKYSKLLGESLLTEFVSCLPKNNNVPNIIPKFNEAECVRIGNLILTEILPEVQIENMVEESIKPIGVFKTGQNINI